MSVCVCVCGAIVIVVGNKDGYSSSNAITLWKGLNPIISPPARSK